MPQVAPIVESMLLIPADRFFVVSGLFIDGTPAFPLLLANKKRTPTIFAVITR
jgi:hypothetical protein